MVSLRPFAFDGGRGQRPQLGAAAFRCREVRPVGFGEHLLDRLRDARAHRALAVAAVDDDIEAAVECQLYEVAADDFHLGSPFPGGYRTQPMPSP
jgi:hypothetical protein